MSVTVARGVICNRYGVPLAEIEPEWGSISWRLNKPGVCRFKMPWSDDKCTADNLRAGNRLLVEFDTGLPDWGGVLDLPRTVSYGSVVQTAYTGEHYLSWRISGRNEAYADKTPAAILTGLVSAAGAVRGLEFELGTLSGAGVLRTEEYHYHNLLDSVYKLSQQAEHDYAVLPVLTGSTLGFVLNWYERRGSDKSAKVWLVDGENAIDPKMDTQGPIANRVVLVGEGSGWTDDRLTAEAYSEESESLYGYREYAEVQSKVASQETLNTNADSVLNEKKVPANRITIQATNESPGTFSEYDVGDIVHAVLFVGSPQWRYEGPVRVLAREWQASGVCRLEVEEWSAS